MRYSLNLAVVAIVSAGVAQAQTQEKPVIGPAPAWVKSMPLPAASDAGSEAPVRVLLSSQQMSLQPDRQTVYFETAMKIQTPQGLAAGNLSFPWRPETDVLSIHKLRLRRGDQTIDILASGQTFTVVRREQNLESAMLDGVLTANIQPEGLQVGDIIEFAGSIASSDPTMKGHVERLGAMWNGSIGRAHLRMQWPASMPLRLRTNGKLPAVKPVKSGGLSTVEMSLDGVEPELPPKGAPLRYQMGRMLEASDFASWADAAALMAPLYQKAAILPAQGPLRDEFNRIERASTDPKARAQAALALVQDRIRYVALVMGVGGYVPADAETTWSRRYGDCKAKTALLLALLHGLGIQAEAVAVNTVAGDGIEGRLPIIGLFNHVLVRATIGGRSYWLDGTRIGDTDLDRLAVPAYGWGLPLVPKGATLVRMMPAPLDRPNSDQTLHIDARAGLTIPAPTKAEMILRGDDAIGVNASLSSLEGAARDRALREYWKGQHDFIEIKSAAATFDPKSGELRLTMEGMAKMDWDDGWYETDGTRVGYKADFSRDEDQDQSAPYAVNFPYYSRMVETILLPPGFPTGQVSDKASVNETVAGIEYRRHATLENDVFRIEKTERSIQPEFPAKDAPAAQTTLRSLADKTVYIRRPDSYRPTDQEVAAQMATTPTTATASKDRGLLLLDLGRFDEAIADFNRALALDPKNIDVLAARAMAHAWKRDFAAASSDMDAVAAVKPNNIVLHRARGLMASMKNDSKGAIDAFSKAIEIDPKDGFSRGHRARLYAYTGQDASALTDADIAVAAYPQMVDLYLLRANIYRKQGKRDEALAQAAALDALKLDDPLGYVMAANIYSAMGKDADMMRAFDRALALKPQAYVYINRSERRAKDDLAGRRADLDAALKLEPDNIDAIIAKGKMLSEIGDHSGAIATYSAGAGTTTHQIILLLNRGIAYARSGDTGRAAKDFAQVTAKMSEPAEFNNACWAKATAGIALDSALADCNAALAKAPDEAAFLDSRGLVYLRLGRLDEAIADYDRAIAKRPHIASSLYGRAIAAARKGDRAKFEADRAAAINADPNVLKEFVDYGVQPPS